MAINRIIFFGTSEFAVASLKSLYDNGYRIQQVITQADQPKGRGRILTPPPVKELAGKLDLDILQPDSIKEPSFLSRIKNLECDLIIVVSYGKILPAELLAIPPLGCINVHGSLLPKYRGAAPIQWAILKGEEETGVTTMQMNEKMDEGGIYLQEKIKMTGKETAIELTETLSRIGAQLLLKTLTLLSENKIKPKPQDHSLSTLAPKITKEDGIIDWNKSAILIERMVRAFQPWPSAYCHYQQKLLKIWEADSIIANDFSKLKAGQVTCVTKDYFQVKCGENSFLTIKKLQIEGKNIMSARDFLAGHHLKKGDMLMSQNCYKPLIIRG